MEEKNPILIIGGDHHNTLAVVRCFGKQKCSILKIIVHCTPKTKHTKIEKTRFARKKVVVLEENETQIIEYLLNIAMHEKDKIVLFPCSDFAEYLIDNNFSSLSDSYIMPGFANKPGYVCDLMDKWKQYEFVVNNHIPMATTWKIDLLGKKVEIPRNISFPCIIKPLVSAFGRKDDIKICYSESDFNNALINYVDKKYTSVIVQRFLKKRYEVCSFGCLLTNHPIKDDKLQIIGASISKTREYPPQGGGSLTYATFINDDSINKVLKNVLSILYRIGYNGMYDIEFLVCEDGIYLNEINFRHSGNGFALIENNVPAPYYWYLDSIGEPFSKENILTVNEGTMMDELSDLHHMRANKIGFFKWLKDAKKSSALAVYSSCDKIGSIRYYLAAIIAFLRR